jgi:hypothetical protein
VVSADATVGNLCIGGVADPYFGASGLNDHNSYVPAFIIPSGDDSVRTLASEAKELFDFANDPITFTVEGDPHLLKTRPTFCGDAPVLWAVTRFNKNEYGSFLGKKETYMRQVTTKKGRQLSIPWHLQRSFSNRLVEELKGAVAPLLANMLIGEFYFDWKVHAPRRIFENTLIRILKKIQKTLSPTTLEKETRASIERSLRDFDREYVFVVLG